jgi:hypothetical protein
MYGLYYVFTHLRQRHSCFELEDVAEARMERGLPAVYFVTTVNA